MSTPQEGDLWYDSTNNILKAHNGTSWDTIYPLPSGSTPQDLLMIGTSTALSRLAIGTSGQFLRVSTSTALSWSSITSHWGTPDTGKAADTVYQATSDGIVFAYAYSGGNETTLVLAGYADSSNPPTTVRAQARQVSTGASYGQGDSISFPVKKDEYYKVTVSGTGYGLSYCAFWPLTTP
jgi:hypothetical protein